MAQLPAGVRAAAAERAQRAGPEDPLPMYLTDVPAIRAHAARIRAALPPEVAVLYAAKANPDPAVLAALAGSDGPLDGVEVASGGELRHVRGALPAADLVFGGPGKTPGDLAAALAARVRRIHVESPTELAALAATAAAAGVTADVLLRANPPLPAPGAVLTMGGVPSPFGMDPDALSACLDLLASSPALRFHGLHAHLASGLGAAALSALAGDVLGWAASWCAGAGLTLAECNLGGGMAVDYADPAERFDWPAYGTSLARLAAVRPAVRLSIEPGRSITAYGGYYVTRVLDVKRSHGEAFAVLAGGTHHLRTPAAKGHDQPFAVLPVTSWPWPWARPAAVRGPVTLAGQLCTPKDVLARRAHVDALRPGDAVVFTMAGAYAWNISHRDFLMHPPPAFERLQGPAPTGQLG